MQTKADAIAYLRQLANRMDQVGATTDDIAIIMLARKSMFDADELVALSCETPGKIRTAADLIESDA